MAETVLKATTGWQACPGSEFANRTAKTLEQGKSNKTEQKRQSKPTKPQTV